MWSSVLYPVTILPFISNVGPTSTLPIDIFTHFFTEELVDKIVNQSNLYASQVMSKGEYDDWDKISVQQKQKDRTRVEIDCPAAIISCSKFMAGVDRGDQLRQYYHVRLKSRKMYIYIF